MKIQTQAYLLENGFLKPQVNLVLQYRHPQKRWEHRRAVAKEVVSLPEGVECAFYSDEFPIDVAERIMRENFEDFKILTNTILPLPLVVVTV
ncbi:MAG: hypothetical protein KGJ06_06160 [Pseudomonadota bacterium]|nr:hypothetical protein [Pseudomonadota bacterium]